MRYWWTCECGVSGTFVRATQLSLASAVRESRRRHGDPLCGGTPNKRTCSMPDVSVDDEQSRAFKPFVPNPNADPEGF